MKQRTVTIGHSLRTGAEGKTDERLQGDIAAAAATACIDCLTYVTRQSSRPRLNQQLTGNASVKTEQRYKQQDHVNTSPACPEHGSASRSWS